MTEDDEKNLEHRLGEIERNADADHEALTALRKEFDKLRTEQKAEFDKFCEDAGKTMRLLMWFTTQVRAVTVLIMKGRPEQADAADQKAREQEVELQKRLSQSQ